MPRPRPQHDQTGARAANETVKLIRQSRQATTRRYSAEGNTRTVMTATRHGGAGGGEYNFENGSASSPLQVQCRPSGKKLIVVPNSTPANPASATESELSVRS